MYLLYLPHLFLAQANPFHLSRFSAKLSCCIRLHPNTLAHIHISAALRVNMKLLSNLIPHCLVGVPLHYNASLPALTGHKLLMTRAISYTPLTFLTSM